MSLVVNRVGSPGTQDTQVTYQIFDRESSKNGSPITKTFSLSYDSIQTGVLQGSVLADTVATLPGLPALLGGGFTITKIVVNGKEFTPNDPQNFNITVHNKYSLDPNLKNTLVSGNNTISIFFNAPLGAGVISPNVQFNSQLFVLGTETLQSKIGITGLPSVSDIGSQLQNWINNNVPTFIAILAVIAIIIVAIAYLASRVP